MATDMMDDLAGAVGATGLGLRKRPAKRPILNIMDPAERQKYLATVDPSEHVAHIAAWESLDARQKMNRKGEKEATATVNAPGPADQIQKAADRNQAAWEAGRKAPAGLPEDWSSLYPALHESDRANVAALASGGTPTDEQLQAQVHPSSLGVAPPASIPDAAAAGAKARQLAAASAHNVTPHFADETPAMGPGTSWQTDVAGRINHESLQKRAFLKLPGTQTDGGAFSYGPSNNRQMTMVGALSDTAQRGQSRISALQSQREAIAKSANSMRYYGQKQLLSAKTADERASAQAIIDHANAEDERANGMDSEIQKSHDELRRAEHGPSAEEVSPHYEAMIKKLYQDVQDQNELNTAGTPEAKADEVFQRGIAHLPKQTQQDLWKERIAKRAGPKAASAKPGRLERYVITDSVGQKHEMGVREGIDGKPEIIELGVSSAPEPKMAIDTTSGTGFLPGKDASGNTVLNAYDAPARPPKPLTPAEYDDQWEARVDFLETKRRMARADAAKQADEEMGGAPSATPTPAPAPPIDQRMAGGQLTAVNPQTGQKLVFKDGAWQPM